MHAAMIGLDWGISAFRAYALDAGGAVLARHAAPAGIMHVAGDGFEQVLRAEIGGWLGPAVPVLASGMITSRQGWVETPYVRAPAGAAELVAALAPHRLADGVTLHCVPGVDRLGDDGVPDVMRGEETQILGAAGDGLFVLPGSHSKWARVEAGRIVWFATFMTGELFAALKHHTILGRLMTATDAFDDDAFAAGLGYAQADDAASGGLLKRLFSVRTLGLVERLPASGLADYLSGLLLGSEIAEAGRCLGGRIGALTVIGGAGLAARYRRALQLSGVSAQAAPADVAAAGLHRIAVAAGLLEARR